MLYRKAGKAAVRFAIIKINRILSTVVEILRVNSARLVNGARKCVRHLRAQTVRQPFGNARLQCVVERLRVCLSLRHPAEAGVAAATGVYRFRSVVSAITYELCSSVSINDIRSQIGIRYSNQMEPVRACISQGHIPIVGRSEERRVGKESRAR